MVGSKWGGYLTFISIMGLSLSFICGAESEAALEERARDDVNGGEMGVRKLGDLWGMGTGGRNGGWGNGGGGGGGGGYGWGGGSGGGGGGGNGGWGNGGGGGGGGGSGHGGYGGGGGGGGWGGGGGGGWGGWIPGQPYNCAPENRCFSCKPFKLYRHNDHIHILTENGVHSLFPLNHNATAETSSEHAPCHLLNSKSTTLF